MKAGRRRELLRRVLPEKRAAAAPPLRSRRIRGGDSTSAAAAASSFDVAGMVTSAAAALDEPGQQVRQVPRATERRGEYAEMSAENLAKLYACAKTGLVNTDSGLGCYAMTPSDYEDFNFFFGE